MAGPVVCNRALLKAVLRACCNAGSQQAEFVSLAWHRHITTSQLSQQEPQPAEPTASDLHSSLRQQPATSGDWGRLPSPARYDVKIVLKSFELRYIQQASIVIRDLMLLHFTPKDQSVLPNQRQPSYPVRLTMPIGDAPKTTARTLYTVIRSPHIDKHSREQFHRTIHKRIIAHSTIDYSEIQWLLDSLKMYQFAGVQISIKLSSPTYLIPTTGVSV